MQLIARFSKDLIEAGVDEVGRGCLAGPVVAAAVVLDPHFQDPGLRDSKRLSASDRVYFDQIIRQQALCVAVGIVAPSVIDQINIANATFRAMVQAVEGLTTAPELLLVDGNRFPVTTSMPSKCLIKGDDRYLSIAAASIVAKVYRDNYMQKIHDECPEFGWKSNKGYPSPVHLEGLLRYGVTKYHRRSYRPVRQQQKIYQRVHHL